MACSFLGVVGKERIRLGERVLEDARRSSGWRRCAWDELYERRIHKRKQEKKKTSSYTYDTILRNGYTIYTVVLIVKE